MLRPALCAPAAGHPNDERYLWLPAEHVMKFGRAIDNQVASEQAEIDGHEFENGAQAAQRRANCCARNHLFCQGSVTHALLTKLLEQSLADGVGAAIPGDVLAQNKNALVAQHFFANGLT